MTQQRVRLVETVGETEQELVLFDRVAPRQDITILRMDIGGATVRERVADRTDNDGVDDETQRHGAAAVSLELRLFDSPTALESELRGWLHPSRRPWLEVVDDEWPGPRRLRLRYSQFSSPIERHHHVLREAQLQWTAPAGVWEAVATVDLVVAADLGSQLGRTYPATWPRTYTATSPSGRLQVVNPGTTWADQVVRLYGPAVGPRFTNDTTGETIAFTEDLVIPGGEFVEVNTAERSANYLGDPDASRLSAFDFELSTWWRIPPGTSQVRYHPISGVEQGAAAALTFRPAWL